MCGRITGLPPQGDSRTGARIHRHRTGVKKRFSNNFQFIASALWSRLEGNYDGNFQASTGQLDPNLNSAYDYADFSVNNNGRLSNDRPSQFKLDGYYRFDFGLAGLSPIPIGDAHHRHGLLLALGIATGSTTCRKGASLAVQTTSGRPTSISATRSGRGSRLEINLPSTSSTCSTARARPGPLVALSSIYKQLGGLPAPRLGDRRTLSNPSSGQPRSTTA